MACEHGRELCVICADRVVSIVEDHGPTKPLFFRGPLGGPKELVGESGDLAKYDPDGELHKALHEAAVQDASQSIKDIKWPMGVVENVPAGRGGKLTIIVPSKFTQMAIYNRDDTEVHWLSCNGCEQSSPTVMVVEDPSESERFVAATQFELWRQQHQCPGKPPKDVVEILEETNPGKHVSVLHGDMRRVGVTNRYSWSCRCGAGSKRADMTIREAQADFDSHAVA